MRKSLSGFYVDTSPEKWTRKILENRFFKRLGFNNT
jgi:hypothetical protein